MAIYRKKSADYSKYEPQNKNPTNYVRFGGYAGAEPWTTRENYYQIASKLFLKCPVSRSCIDIRASKIRSVDIMVDKGNDFSRRLIERPNFTDRTMNELLSKVEVELLIGGDAWLFLNTTPGQTPTLSLLRQDFVVQKPLQNRIEYDPAVLEGKSNPQLIFVTAPDQPDEVIEVWQQQGGKDVQIEGSLLHLMHFNPLSASSGSGVADAALRQVDTWLMADRLMERRFAAGGRNQGIMTLPADTDLLSDEEFNELKSRLEQLGDLREIEWAANGTNFLSTQMSFKDLDLYQIRNQLERNIASAFAVPAVMLNMEGEASYANQRGVDRIFYTGVLEPRVSWMLSHIQAFLRDSTSDKRLVLTIDESQIEYLKVDKMEVAKAASSMKIATVNELREMIGLKAIADGNRIPEDAKQPEPTQSEDQPREVGHNADTSRRNQTR